MRAIKLLLRSVAFLFNLVLSLGLFFLALVVMPSGRHNIQLPAVPLKGSNLTYGLLAASICGFVAMALALRKGRVARLPMLLWNIFLTALLLWTPFRGQFSFEGRDHMLTGLCVFLASLVALWGSWLQWKGE